MQCVILFRNSSNNLVGFVSNDDGEDIAVFKDAIEAANAANSIPICQAYPYQIVELSDIPPRG